MSIKPHRWFSVLLLRMRVRKVIPFLNGRILDIGCCVGALVPFISNMDGYVGVDVDENAISIHKRTYPENTLYCLDVQNEVIPSGGKFDTMVAMAVLEHLERPDDFLMKYIPLVKKGGTVVITTPTPVGDRIHGFLQKLKIANPVVSDVHFNIYTGRKLIQIMEKHGVKVESVKHFEMGMNQVFAGKLK